VLIGAAAGAATVASFWIAGIGNPLRRRRVEPTGPGEGRRALSEDEWATLEAALDRILPSEPDAPGAREVNAIGYLDAVLADEEVDAETRALVKDGAARLDELSRKRGAANFPALAREGQEALLRSFETDARGVEWLRKTIAFALEALLGDPVHGGNTDEVGWRWIGHRPGIPRPTRGD
jgi:gluconate 2-dehydrogenase gamma chain